MANSLSIDLKKGDKIVLKGGIVAEAGGECYGSFTFTTGRCLDVYINGKPYRHDGFDIDREETLKRFSKENGWPAKAT